MPNSGDFFLELTRHFSDWSPYGCGNTNLGSQMDRRFARLKETNRVTSRQVEWSFQCLKLHKFDTLCTDSQQGSALISSCPLTQAVLASAIGQVDLGETDVQLTAMNFQQP